MSVNKVILVGNLGKDPEVRFTQTGSAVANFSIATTEQWNDREGKRQERTEWHNIVVWGKQGEACGQYLAKGRQVYGVKRYVTEIVAQRIQFLGGGGGTRIAHEMDSGSGEDPAGGGTPPMDDDVPF